jgi:hypothetical protein
MPTELRKPVSRKVGKLIVTIDSKGVVLRGFRKPRKYRVTFGQIAAMALRGEVNLTADEWQNPVSVITSKWNPKWRIGNRNQL